MNDAQQAAARRLLDYLRESPRWPRRGGANGPPKNGGVHDATFDGERHARVLIMVDSRDVALGLLDPDGTLAAIQLAAPLDADGRLVNRFRFMLTINQQEAHRVR